MALQSLKRWHVAEAAPATFLESKSEHPLLMQVLYSRGVRTPEAVKAFLTFEDAVLENPYRLRDMQPAVERILQAIERQEVICVYGDFDADGVCSTVLLVSALQAAGAQVGPYIPDRVDEGYGLNMEAIDRVAAKAKLMITVDCGIRSMAEVQHAVDLGMDVIVTDHHSVGADLPPALAVINPRRPDDTSKFEKLAGVGVTYRLAQAVLREVAKKKDAKLNEEQVAALEESLLELVALGTVADVMPLLGENRSLVRRGLIQLNRTQRTGMKALLAQADLRAGSVDSTAIAFRLAPRINAAGRLAHAKLAYDLLRTSDPAKAYSHAAELEALNQRRQNLTAEAQAEAEKQIVEQSASDPALYIVRSSNFLPGIVGLVAGKLTERFYRPTAVIEQGENESRGSARSIEEFDISAALDEVRHLLLRHGGHTRAAGFTLKTAQLPDFSQALLEVAKRQLSSYNDLRPSLAIDAEVKLDQLDWNVLEQLARLDPFGQENPHPLFVVRNVRVRDARRIGQNKHLKLGVDDGAKTRIFDAVAFNQSEQIKWLPDGVRIDIVFQLEANEWNGRKMLQLNVQDMAYAS